MEAKNMADFNPTVSTPETPQELEQAIQNYRNDSTWSEHLFQLWESIRSAALALRPAEALSDAVPGEDSY